MEYVDLVMDNGELARIEYRDEHMDELLESLEHTMKRRDWWSPNNFDGCSVVYMGLCLDRVSMGRVVGILS